MRNGRQIENIIKNQNRVGRPRADKTRMLLLAIIFAMVINVGSGVYAFLPPPSPLTQIVLGPAILSSSTSLYKKKPSMKERRKQRANRKPSITYDRGLLDELSPVDKWEKTTSTAEDVAAETEGGDDADKQKLPIKIIDEESEKTKAKASALVQTQRKSVASLTFIRKRVEESAFPYDACEKSISENGYFVYDNFLSNGDDSEELFGNALLSEMLQECSDMLANDKLERDITRLGDGEYLTKIVGGEAYGNCPRLTEYIVSLTRHLPPLFNKELDELAVDINNGGMVKLDATASMGTLRVYNRKTRLSESSLLKEEDGDSDKNDRPFGVICGDSEGTENDTRRLTAMLFLSAKDWDATTCKGGITVEKTGEKVDAKRDRLILLQSDTCSYRQEPWIGDDKEGLDQAGCLIVHFVKDTARS